MLRARVGFVTALVGAAAAACGASRVAPSPPTGSPIATATSSSPPPAAGKPTLTVTSDPPGALVFFGGVQIGTTPLAHVEVSPGKHPIVLVLRGYEPVFGELTTAEGQSSSFVAALRAVDRDRPASGDRAAPETPSCFKYDCQHECERDGWHECLGECGRDDAPSSCEFTCKQIVEACKRNCEKTCY